MREDKKFEVSIAGMRPQDDTWTMLETWVHSPLYCPHCGMQDVWMRPNREAGITPYLCAYCEHAFRTAGIFTVTDSPRDANRQRLVGIKGEAS